MAGLIGLLNYLDQRSGREQYGNLLNEYRVPGDPNAENPGPYALGSPEMNQALLQRQGGFRGEGGVLSGGPPQEFYMRAAALPGYQQLAQQAQVGQQQMEQQMQAQKWQEQNLTAGQKATLEQDLIKEQWRYERPTYYEAAQLSVRREELDQQDWARRQNVAQGWGNLGLNQAEFNAKYIPDPKNPKGFMPRPTAEKTPVGYRAGADGSMVPIPGTDDWRKGQEQIAAINSGAEGARKLAEHLTNYGTAEVWNREQAATANVHRNAAITGLGQLSNMGVLQPGDLDRLSAQLADPTDFGPNAIVSRRGPYIAAAKEVAQRLEAASSAASSRFRGESAPANPTKVLTYNSKTGRLE